VAVAKGPAKLTYIATDTETFLIDRAQLAPDLVCMQWCGADLTPQIAHAVFDPLESLVRTCLESTAILVGHNMAYDAGVLMSAYPQHIPLWFAKYACDQVICTEVQQKLIDIASGENSLQRKKAAKQGGGYSLAVTAGRYGLAKDGDDPWRKRYGELIGTPKEQWPADATSYALSDPLVTYQLCAAQLAKHGDILGDAAAQSRAALALHLQSCWGFHTSPTGVEALRRRVQQRIDSAKAELMLPRFACPICLGARQITKQLKRGPKRYTCPDCRGRGLTGLVRADGTRNLKAAASAMAATCKKLGIEPQKTDKDAVSLSAEACQATGDSLLLDYSVFCTQNTLKARVDDLAEGYQYPLQPSFDSLVETGRTSSRKPSLPLRGVQSRTSPGSRERASVWYRGRVTHS